jgi:hypothetical protein
MRTTAPFAAIERPSLADRVYDALLEQILLGEYQPGERLSVDLLAEHFSVSRTPIREALTQLQGDRFVDIYSNSRTLVASWGPDDIAERVRLVARIVDLLTDGNGAPTVRVPTDECPAVAFIGSCEPVVAAARGRVSGQMAQRCLDHVSRFTQLRHLDGCDCAPIDLLGSTVLEIGDNVAVMLAQTSSGYQAVR